MEQDILLSGKKITLKKATKALWHEYYKSYVIDPMMDTTPYSYNFERIEKAYYSKTADITRLYFVIIHEGRVIGQIYLKHMDNKKKTTEFGMALINDSVKGKGYGTEAINLLTDYAFNTLGIESIIADSVLRNTRSQHVLEKVGFAYTHKDSDFMYYGLKKTSGK